MAHLSRDETAPKMGHPDLLGPDTLRTLSYDRASHDGPPKLTPPAKLAGTPISRDETAPKRGIQLWCCKIRIISPERWPARHLAAPCVSYCRLDSSSASRQSRQRAIAVKPWKASPPSS